MKGFSLDRIKISYNVIVNNTYIFMNLLSPSIIFLLEVNVYHSSRLFSIP